MFPRYEENIFIPMVAPFPQIDGQSLSMFLYEQSWGVISDNSEQCGASFDTEK